MNIPESIADRINHPRWKFFARSNGIQLGNLKEDCINNIQEALSSDVTLNDKLLSFVANEISRGKNRYMHVCLFSPTKKINLQKKDLIERVISSKFNGSATQNDLLNIYKPNSNDIGKSILVYSNITYKNTDENLEIPDKISLCFKEFYKIEGFNYGGVQIPSRIETDYIWCDIHINKQMVIVKSKDESSSNKKTRTANIICDKYQKILFEKFDLGEMLSVGEINNTLYKIYKDFTDTAEREFKDIVKPFQEKIINFTNEISNEINLTSAEYPLNIPLRVQRLFERSLIQQHFEKYITFFKGKKGIVTRLFFSDESGATVNARSGDQSKEGIAVADIYFDTRETIDEIKALEIIWVTWFVQYNDTLINNTKTKIFVSNRNFVVHFLYDYVLEEEESYVFSNIEEIRKQI